MLLYILKASLLKEEFFVLTEENWFPLPFPTKCNSSGCSIGLPSMTKWGPGAATWALGLSRTCISLSMYLAMRSKEELIGWRRLSDQTTRRDGTTIIPPFLSPSELNHGQGHPPKLAVGTDIKGRARATKESDRLVALKKELASLRCTFPTTHGRSKAKFMIFQPHLMGN